MEVRYSGGDGERVGRPTYLIKSSRILYTPHYTQSQRRRRRRREKRAIGQDQNSSLMW
jgi:hypothetical protein